MLGFTVLISPILTKISENIIKKGLLWVRENEKYFTEISALFCRSNKTVKKKDAKVDFTEYSSSYMGTFLLPRLDFKTKCEIILQEIALYVLTDTEKLKSVQEGVFVLAVRDIRLGLNGNAHENKEKQNICDEQNNRFANRSKSENGNGNENENENENENYKLNLDGFYV